MPGETILIVEDEAIIALEESLALRKAGFMVMQAANGRSALEAVRTRQGKLGLILMDINLGSGPDGTQIAQEILRDYDIPILFCSSHTEDEMVARTEKITSFGYVVKMSGPTVLTASVKMAFKLHRAQRELREKQAALLRRDAILEAVGSTAMGFLDAEDWEAGLRRVVERLGRAAEVSRCCILENRRGTAAEARADRCYEWSAPGVPAHDGCGRPDRPASEELLRLADALAAGGDYFGDAAALPEAERGLFESRGAKSMLAVPIVARSDWWGFICFDECRERREWTSTEREALRIAAGFIGAVLQRRTAMRSLYQNEKAFRAVVANTIEGFSQTTPAGRYLKANSVLARMLGYDSPEQLMSEVVDIGAQLYVDPAARLRYKSVLERDGQISGFAAEFRRRDGSTIWMSIDAGAIRDELGRTEYYYSVNSDITALKTSRSV